MSAAGMVQKWMMKQQKMTQRGTAKQECWEYGEKALNVDGRV